MKSKKVFFITGASSGIGRALALKLSKKGVTLGLVARRLEKLQSTKTQCEQLGAKTYIYQMDVTDHAGMALIAKDFIAKTGQIDVVIANAGIASHSSPFEMDSIAYSNMMHVNVLGVVHTHLPFLAQMKKQGNGQLVTINSIAGFLLLPGGTYSATKVALRYLMEGWRSNLRPYNIKVTNIFPGFIESEMTDPTKNNYPFLVSTEKSADLITRAIFLERKNYILPWQMSLVVPVLRVFPDLIIWAQVAKAEADKASEKFSAQVRKVEAFIKKI